MNLMIARKRPPFILSSIGFADGAIVGKFEK